MRNNQTKKRDKSTTTAALDSSFLDLRTKKSDEEVCSFYCVAAAITDEIFPIAARQEESSISEANSSTKQTKGKHNHSSTSSKQQQQKKQPLFAAVIQNWFLEERMKARGIALGSKSSKKKKKKEKKGDQTPIHDGGDNSADEESAMNFLENGATMSSTSQSSPASPSSSRKLDCILDKFIDLQIEGVDDCEPNVIEGRDLQAFATFLGHKFKSYLDEQQRQQQSSQKKSKDASIKSPLHSTDNLHCGNDFAGILPTIAMADVNDNAQKAQCACGRAIKSHLNTWEDKYQSVKQTIVLEAKTEDDEDDITGSTNKNDHGLSIPVCSNYLDADNDDPFAYGALIDDEFDLEAGVPSTEVAKIDDTSSLRLELSQISSPTDAARYLQVDPVCTQNDGGREYAYPIDEQSILNLVKCVIVPSGINDGDDIECALNDKDIQFIKERAEAAENKFLHQFFDMLRVAETCKTRLNAAREEQIKRTIFDPKTSNELQDTDKELNWLLTKILLFLIRVTEYSCCVGWISEKISPISIVTQLWNEFEKMQLDLVEPSLKVRGTGIQVKGRPGKVPQAYCNTAVLSSYEEFVCLKMNKIDRLLYFFRSEFLNRPDWNSSKFLKTNIPSQMLRLCVLEAYGVRKHNLSADDVFPDEECRECLVEMVEAKMGLPQVNKHSTLRAVERAEADRLERFKLAYKKVVEIVTKADAHLTCQTSPDVAFLVSGAEMYESKRLDYELEEKKPSESSSFLALDDEDDSSDVNLEESISRAMNKSGVLLLQWISILTMEIYSKSANKKFPINRELKVYMDGEVKNPCEGGGERKVSVILATLIYRWLETKYNEWHAELTREELWQEAMDLTKPQSTTKGATSKKSKKKKSKKKKKVKEESTETSRAASVIDSSSSNVDSEDVKDAGIDSELVSAESEEIKESAISITSNGFDLDDNFHPASDVGWTTVGAKASSEVDSKIIEEIDTARDEEIARALQEQYREEAKEYEAEYVDTPSAQDSSVKSGPSIVQEEDDEEEEEKEVVPDDAAKVSNEVKTSKPSKSKKAKAKQTRNVDAKNTAAKQDGTNNDDSGRNGDCPKSDAKRTDQSQSEVKADKTKVEAAAQSGNAVKSDSDSAKEGKSIALQSQTNTSKKKQVATKAAKMNVELSTDNRVKAVNSAASSTNVKDKGDTKEEQSAPQAAVKQTDDYRPKVGVYEGDQFVDAETYLVSRMKRVQKKLIWL